MTLEQKAIVYLCVARVEGVIIAGYALGKGLDWIKAKLEKRIRGG